MQVFVLTFLCNGVVHTAKHIAVVLHYETQICTAINGESCAKFCNITQNVQNYINVK